MRYKIELKIKMTAYNKLKIAILAIITSQNIHAITIDPIQIQSAPGELLYAEMNFRQADPNSQIQASLASAEDITTLGVAHQPPGHLNFFTRRDGSGNGVITITSSRPLTEAELNIIIKIQEGNATRLQHIKTPLQRGSTNTQASIANNEKHLAPITIVSEKDIALHLPESTQYQVTKTQPTAYQSFEAPLMVQKAAPPSLNAMTPAPVVISSMSMPSAQTNETGAEIKTSAPEKITTKDQINDNPLASNKITSNTSFSADPLVKKYAESPTQKVAENKIAEKPAEQAAAKTKPETPTPTHKQPKQQTERVVATAQTTKHVVQSNESLWAIASRVATEQNRPIGEVMKQIKANNEHAFIQGDVNRLRRGAALNLNTSNSQKEDKKVSVSNVAKTPSNQSGKAKYRLNQAEMSLVAEKEQDSASGSAKKNTEKNQTSNELSLKVMTSRKKTVKLQRNVTQLELALRHKDHRIQLLNTRLAQLQQQLKAQQVEKKPTH
jgi:Tfp pilus assembly protein FimV